jgi:integrase
MEVINYKHEKEQIGSAEAYDDHNKLIHNYLNSYVIRNYSPRTIKKEEKFLNSWFEEHGDGLRPLYTWEAMEPVKGRKRVVDYANTLLNSLIKSDTIRSYLGILRRYFSYVLEQPYLIQEGEPVRVDHKYGSIDQPVSEFDIPKHVYDGERLGVPLDPEKLYEFFEILHTHYLDKGAKALRARNYAMVVLAGESGLRADELANLTVEDLFWDSYKIQTRHAKGTKGSGKRSRLTLFTPIARDTVKYYLKNYRSKIQGSENTNYLFLSRSGKLLCYSGMHSALEEMLSICKKNKFPIMSHFSWHWMRRIFATRFIERFPNRLSTLIELLGHVTPNTVHRYIRHSKAWMDEEIQKVLKEGVKWPLIGD